MHVAAKRRRAKRRALPVSQLQMVRPFHDVETICSVLFGLQTMIVLTLYRKHCVAADIEDVKRLDKWIEAKVQQNKEAAQRRNQAANAFASRNSDSGANAEAEVRTTTCFHHSAMFLFWH